MKLVAMETLRPAVQPNLLLLRLHADDGAAGLGEAFFGAAAVEGFKPSGVERLQADRRVVPAPRAVPIP